MKKRVRMKSLDACSDDQTITEDGATRVYVVWGESSSVEQKAKAGWDLRHCRVFPELIRLDLEI